MCAKRLRSGWVREDDSGGVLGEVGAGVAGRGQSQEEPVAQAVSRTLSTFLLGSRASPWHAQMGLVLW